MVGDGVESVESRDRRESWEIVEIMEKRESWESWESWENVEFCGQQGVPYPRRLNDTNLNNSFVGCGRHWWRPYMMAINIVLLLWRECVLSRLFVYFRSAIVDYCTTNGGGDW